MSTIPGSLPVLSAEAGALIETFVAGFQAALTRSNHRANVRAWFGWADAGGVDGLAMQCADVEAVFGHPTYFAWAPNAPSM